MKFNLFLIFFITVGCSNFSFLQRNKDNGENIQLDGYTVYDNQDYIDHLNSLKVPYLESKDIQKITLSKSSNLYIQEIANNIIKKNELFFVSLDTPEFFIVNSEAPFHFSLPGRKIFISSGLINKYIKSENLLYCLITFELIRSEKNIYKKNIIVPTGFISTRRMLSLLRLSINEKVEIHKWAFYILKRVEVDTDNYLSWLQIQNRNSVDFSLQLGDISSISREESLFKAFIIQNTQKKIARQHEGSSRGFYSFVKNLKRSL